MKIFSYAAIALLLLFTACKKNTDGTTTDTKIPDYSGSYKGTVTVSVNGSITKTIFNGIVIAVNVGNRQQLTLVNNYIYSSAVYLTGTTWNLPKATAVTSSTSNYVEYGSGTFSEGGNMAFEFYQDDVNPANNQVRSTTKWAGTLVRQ